MRKEYDFSNARKNPYEAQLKRQITIIRRLAAEVLQEPKVNPNARHREVWRKDPDGYVVVIAGRYGDLGSGAELLAILCEQPGAGIPARSS